MTERSQDK